MEREVATMKSLLSHCDAVFHGPESPLLYRLRERIVFCLMVR